MRSVKLYGELGRRFGERFEMDVKTPAEVIRALCVNLEGFEKFLCHAHESNLGFKVLNAELEIEGLEGLHEPLGREIKIVPVIMGANAESRILIGVALVGLAFSGAPFLAAGLAHTLAVNVGIGLALGGVMQLISPPPKAIEPAERPDNKPSYIFNGPVNTTAQGQPVPVCYGRLVVGGAVVSAGLRVDQLLKGQKRVQTEATVDILAFNDPENLQGTPPANWFKRDLAGYTVYPEDDVNYPGYAVWTYRYHYYQWTLVDDV